MIKPYSQNAVYSQRKERDERVRNNPRHWLALAGLFVLEDGDNSFGSTDAKKIMLPGFPHPHSGCLHLKDGQVSLTEYAEGVLLNRQPAESRLLKADADGDPDLIEAGPIHLMVIRRGGKAMLRAWDVESPALKAFKGFKYFPVNLDYCVDAKFIPYDPPKTFTVTNVLGFQNESCLLGEVHFKVNGESLVLQVEDAEDEGLISFVDETRKDLTYPGGRFLTLPKPLEATTSLDFNTALNWPCAYTVWATCPLPPKENYLPVRIEAGEMRYHEKTGVKMTARIDMLGIFANDMQVMVPFYRDVLGFETDWDGQSPYAEFKNEGVRFSMYRRKELADLFNETPTFPHALNGTFEIALDFPTSADADREYERIVAAGARSLYAPRDEPWGMRSSMVADPENNIIEIGSWNNG